MFVYRINSYIAYYPFTALSIEHELSNLRHSLLQNHGLDYQSNIIYDYYTPEVHLLCPHYLPVDTCDWQPQFSFKVCKNNRGIYLEGLRLPKEFRKKGIGTLCTDWLKKFCAKFGFTYIVLGSYNESKSFWSKLDFTEITEEEYVKKYPVW